MNSDTAAQSVAASARRRILRLALGTAASTAVSQAIGWPLAYVASIITALLLALPVPPPRPRQALMLALAVLLPLLFGLWVLLPLLWFARWAGILLLMLALFHAFYLAARTASPVAATCATLALAVTITIGSVSPALLAVVPPALLLGIATGIAGAWFAHLLLPEVVGAPAAAGAPPGSPAVHAPAWQRALRSLLVIAPLALLFLFSGASPGYTPVMIKSASVAQQAGLEQGRRLSLALLASTFWGGAGAVVAWQLLSLWPSLLLFTLLTGLFCLCAGPFIFRGAGLDPRAPVASYALVTFIIVLAPSLADSPLSSPASAAFWTRLLLFLLVALYGTLALSVLEAFWPSGGSRDVPGNDDPAGRKTGKETVAG